MTSSMPVARVLDKEDIIFFVVDSLFEATAMRSQGILSPILVIGYTSPHNIQYCHLRDVSFTITDLKQLEEISTSLTWKKQFHLKVDTGMHRQGILPNQLEEALTIFKNSPRIDLVGLCSHLADADNEDDTFTKKQLDVWNKLVPMASAKFPSIKYYHIAATAGLAHHQSIQGNVVRLGIGLYGITVARSSARMRLKPVLQLQSIISSLKTIAKDEYIGYAVTYRMKKKTLAATVPLGYAEGIARGLGDKGVFTVRGVVCPILGRVSMNITSIDVSAVSNINVGDTVVAISSHEEDRNSVAHIATDINTIPYEVLVHIPSHLRRTVV